MFGWVGCEGAWEGWERCEGAQHGRRARLQRCQLTPPANPAHAPSPPMRCSSLACSTCHVVVEDQGVYDSLPEPTDDENDMLDLAFGLTDT